MRGEISEDNAYIIATLYKSRMGEYPTRESCVSALLFPQFPSVKLVFARNKLAALKRVPLLNKKTFLEYRSISGILKKTENG